VFSNGPSWKAKKRNYPSKQMAKSQSDVSAAISSSNPQNRHKSATLSQESMIGREGKRNRVKKRSGSRSMESSADEIISPNCIASDTSNALDFAHSYQIRGCLACILQRRMAWGNYWNCGGCYLEWCVRN